MLVMDCPLKCGMRVGCPRCKGRGYLYVIRGKVTRRLPGFHYVEGGSPCGRE